MTRILLDPASLEATARVLREVARALGELGKEVAGAAASRLPPHLAAGIELELATLGLSLGTIGLELSLEADDLDQRMASVAAAETGFDLSTVAASVVGPGLTAVLHPPTAIVGGAPAASTTPSGSLMDALFGGGMVVGGSGQGWSVVGAPDGLLPPEGMVVGGPPLGATTSLGSVLGGTTMVGGSGAPSELSVVRGDGSAVAVGVPLGSLTLADLGIATPPSTTIGGLSATGGAGGAFGGVPSSVMAEIALQPTTFAAQQQISNAQRAIIANQATLGESHLDVTGGLGETPQIEIDLDAP